MKNSGNQPEKVSVKGCADLADFADKVREKFGTNCQVAFFTSLGKEPLDPGLAVKELLKTDLANNSDEKPLLFRLSPLVQDPVVTKTIYVRDTYEDGEFTDKYFKYKVKDNEDLRIVYNDGKGLVHLSAPKKLILDFNQIRDGEKYQVHKYSRYFQG